MNILGYFFANTVYFYKLINGGALNVLPAAKVPQ